MLNLIKKTYARFLSFKTNCAKRLPHCPDVNIASGAIIEGPPERIILGPGTIIEDGAILSTVHGGNIRLGEGCIVCRGAMLMTYGGDITSGDFCGVNPYSIIYGHGGVKIGNYVRFAAHCVVIPANHTFEMIGTPIYKQPLNTKGIIIDSDVWVGANVCLLDGVKVGEGAVIGAGSVVSKDIAPYTVNVGNPARQIKNRKGSFS